MKNTTIGDHQAPKQAADVQRQALGISRHDYQPTYTVNRGVIGRNNFFIEKVTKMSHTLNV